MKWHSGRDALESTGSWAPTEALRTPISDSAVSLGIGVLAFSISVVKAGQAYGVAADVSQRLARRKAGHPARRHSAPHAELPYNTNQRAPGGEDAAPYVRRDT